MSDCPETVGIPHRPARAGGWPFAALPAAAAPAAQNGPLFTLFVFNGLFVFAASLLGPLYALYVESIDGSVLAVSVTWAVFFVTSFACTFVVSRVGDRLREKEGLLLAGYLIRAVAWSLFAFAGSLVHFILLQILLGLGEALGSPAFDAIFAEHLDDGRHVEEYAHWKLVVSGTTAAGSLLGGVIVNMLGFRWLFLIMAGLALAVFLAMYQRRCRPWQKNAASGSGCWRRSGKLPSASAPVRALTPFLRDE